MTPIRLEGDDEDEDSDVDEWDENDEDKDEESTPVPRSKRDAVVCVSLLKFIPYLISRNLPVYLPCQKNCHHKIKTPERSGQET
jgi:hypothetical protein